MYLVGVVVDVVVVVVVLLLLLLLLFLLLPVLLVIFDAIVIVPCLHTFFAVFYSTGLSACPIYICNDN